MIDGLQINSVSKNNFLSLMKSYERNYNYAVFNGDKLEIKNF